MNKNIIAVEPEIGGRKIRLETGLLARQAGGSVTARIGDTIVFSAATASKSVREGIDFFPLQVEYREKFYAAGRFPGGYFKREARPTEKEIVTARATDRPIRPLFPEDYRNDVQIMNTLLCADGDFDADILSITAASASLTLSDIPFLGPIAAVRIGRVDGEFIVNPTHAELDNSDLDLLYVGTRDLPMMIEGSAREVPDEVIPAAMRFAQPFVTRLVEAQLELRRMCGLPDKEISIPEKDDSLLERLRGLAADRMHTALTISAKRDRSRTLDQLYDEILASLREENPELSEEDFKNAFHDLEKELVRRMVLEETRRIDGRGFDEVRPLDAAVGILPRTHGSALFSRGETQALATITLGTISDAQAMDALAGGPDEKRFMLHYNFPPYSVGEVRRIGSPGRREIGHGSLAERSLVPVMPPDYVYTVRVVSEIMESNGSTSMASVCAGSLALMDAGVPTTRNVAGISIGLITGKDRAAVLVDILGDEDHCGDMDFKLAGTRQGVTGFQLDLKIPGLDWEILEQAVAKSHTARMHILDFMDGVMAAPRGDISPYAPRVERIKIDREKIGALIGPGGKTIRRITETTGVQIDVEEDGTVNVYSADKPAMDAAIREIEAVTAEAEIGKIYRGKVTSIKDFGCFVEIFPGKEGLVHVSELANFRVGRVEDICKIGDPMWVKCISIDDQGRVRLSRRAALDDRREQGLEEPGEEQPPAGAAQHAQPQRDSRRESRRGSDRRGGRRRRR